MISQHIFRRHTFCQRDSVRCFRRMWSRAGITRRSWRPSGACCPTRLPPRPGCPPGPSRRPRRPSRRFSLDSTSSYFPPTNTSRKTGKVFWIAWVISCRYCGDVTLNSLGSQARQWRVVTPRTPACRRSDARTSWWRTQRRRPPCARWEKNYKSRKVKNTKYIDPKWESKSCDLIILSGTIPAPKA